MVEHKHHWRDKPLEIVDERLAILTPDYGLWRPRTVGSIDRQSSSSTVALACSACSTRCGRRRFADTRDPVEVDHPASPRSKSSRARNSASRPTKGVRDRRLETDVMTKYPPSRRRRQQMSVRNVLARMGGILTAGLATFGPTETLQR